MGAAAKLHRVAVQRGGLAANLHHPHHVAVFLAEELPDVFAALDVAVFGLGPGDRGVFEDVLVDEAFDISYLLRGERRTAEIEGELLRPDIRTLLHRIPANHLMQRPVE